MALEPVEKASGSSDKTVLRRGKQRDLFGKTAQMQAYKGERLQIFQNEIAVAGGVHRVGCGRRETQALARQCCDRAQALRQPLRPSQAGSSLTAPRSRAAASASRRDHLNISQQPVRHQHRLGALQVRIARHHCVFCGASLARPMHRPTAQALQRRNRFGCAHKAADRWRSARCGCGLCAA